MRNHGFVLTITPSLESLEIKITVFRTCLDGIYQLPPPKNVTTEAIYTNTSQHYRQARCQEVDRGRGHQGMELHGPWS